MANVDTVGASYWTWEPARVGHLLFTADLTGDGKPDLVWKQYPRASSS